VSTIQGKRILIVEDEFLIATTASEMLEELGAIIVGPAATVPQALNLVEKEAIDIALLDINLYGQSSSVVATSLESQGIPVVFATGYGKGDGKDSAGRYVLGKPYTQEKLARQLCRALKEIGRQPQARKEST
jgi:CheY-like chemotaxis protein